MKKDEIMKIVVFIVVLFIPIIYSFFYLKSYWDPYGDLTGVSVAIVNLDKGEDGENQGKEFVEGLKDTGTFNICEVSEEEASEGMKKGDYYATITVPSNFTECLNSAASKDKQIATVTYNPNQATNYLATQIINSGVKTMELSLEEKINSKIVETLAGKLQEVPDSLEEISDGAEQILDGAKSLNSGLEQINDGTATLNSSYTEFDNGINSAADGGKELENGIKQVNTGVTTLNTGANSLDTAIAQINAGAEELSSEGSQGIVTLANGVSTLNEGASNLNTGVASYVDGTTTLANGTTMYVAGTENLVNNVNNYIDNVNNLNGNINTLLQAMAQQSGSDDQVTRTLASQAQAILNSEAISQITYAGTAIKNGESELMQNDEALKVGAQSLLGAGETVKQGSASLAQGVQTLYQGTSGLTELTDGITTLKTALSQVQDGTTTLKTGVSTLSAGTEALETGSSDLSDGLETLRSSSTQVKTALDTLEQGTNEAYNGSSDLVSGVETFEEEINKGLEETNEQLETLNGIEKFAENPVEFKTEPYGEVNSYGIAFTPLFLSIGLWVGALMCYVVLYYDQKNRFSIFGSSNKNKLVQNILYIAIGAVEGILTGYLLKLGLGYDVQSSGLYYMASALIGITFMSIIQFLIRNFGDVGKFLALIILVLQLAASGGTFPVETISKGFQSISSYLPMTYTIKLLREILVPTATNFRGKYIGILLCITIVTLGITYAVDIIRNKKEKEN